MKKLFGLFVAILAIAVVAYTYLNNRPTRIIAVHQNEYIASILVDHLPLSETDRIAWWLKNQDGVIDQYKIKPGNDKGVISYFFYAFGDGYKQEEGKDRLCFEDMPGPENCIEKNLLMMVMRTRDGGKQFIFDDGVYIQGKDGSLSKSSKTR